MSFVCDCRFCGRCETPLCYLSCVLVLCVGVSCVFNGCCAFFGWLLFKVCCLMHLCVIAFCCGRRGFPLFCLSCLYVISVVVSCIGAIALCLCA